jgi:hypothetical protein
MSSIRAQAPFLSECGEDQHIDPAKRSAIEASAMQFAKTAVGGDSTTTYGLLSKEGRAAATHEELVQLLGLLRQFEPTNLAPEHTYLIDIKGVAPKTVVCGTNLAQQDGWAALSVSDLREQAYSLISADMVNNKLTFTLWLVPEDGTWKVQSFWMNASTLADKDSEQLWKLAQSQNLLGHRFNATLLLAAAGQAANRGPNFQMGITQPISEDWSKLSVPAEVQGQPPFLWKDGEKTYKVTNVSPMAIGGKIYVVIVHEVPPWKDDNEVVGWNREVLSYFEKRFPEFTDAFAGVVARATEQGGHRGYGTVDGIP